MTASPETAEVFIAFCFILGYMAAAVAGICLIAVALMIARQRWLEWRQYRRSMNLPPPDDSTRRFISAFEKDWKTRRGSDTDWRSAA